MGKFTILPETQIVRTQEAAERMVRKLRPYKKLAVDSETTGISTSQDYAIIISISCGLDRWVIFEEAFPYIADLLQDPSIQLIMWNAKFDLHMILNAGIDILAKTEKTSYRIIDSMVAHHMVDDDRPHSLKFATLELLNIRMKSFTEVFGDQMKTRTLHEILLDPDNEDVVAHYAGLDAYVTAKCHTKLRKKLMEIPCNNRSNVYKHIRTQWDLFMAFEVPYTTILFGCERRGVCIDQSLLHRFAARYDAELGVLSRWFVQETRKVDFNPNSGKQVAAHVYDVLGYECTEFTDTGQRATGKNALKKIAQDGCEFAAKVLEYTAVRKKLSTYVMAPLQKHRRGRVHTTFKQIGARSGRLASSDPNLQNQPPFIREAYIASPGYYFFARDYSQVEIRVFATLSDDPVLKQSILDGDPHVAVAAMMFGENYDEILEAKRKDDVDDKHPDKVALTSNEKRLLGFRKAAKTLNFGLLYGMGLARLAAAIGVSREVAEEYLELYFDAMPNARIAQEAMIEFSRENGYSESMFGKRRQLYGFYSALNRDESSSERQAKNTPIQGTAAGIALLAMLALWEDKYLEECGVHMLVQIHDEILLEIPIAHRENKKLFARIKHLMETPMGLRISVPLDTTGKSGGNWLQTK